MSSIVYNTFKGKDGNDFAAGLDSAYKVMLLTGTYTPDPDHLHPNATGLAANEITGGSYARQNLASRTRTVNNTTDKVEHAANNPTFSALAASSAPRWAIVYRVVTDDTDSQLVCCIDLGAGLSVSGDFTVKWSGTTTSGILFTGS